MPAETIVAGVPFDAALTLAVLALTVLALAREVLNPDLLLVTALAVLVSAGVLDMETALRGFSNPALLTVGALLVVAAGLRATGMLERAARTLLGRGRSLRRSLARLTGSTALASAFMSNTAVVAMGIPAVAAWADRQGVPLRRLLIPLSYASILGGVCTLIGTSTNLVADGLLRTHGLGGLGFFELAAAGLPVAAVGTAYLVFVAPRLLPDDEVEETADEEGRQYVADMLLEAPSPLVGKTVEEAELRSLPGLFLIRIERETGVVAPVGHAEQLAAGDRLTFAGVVDRIAELRRFRGLRPVATAHAPGEEAGWELHEAVVSPGSPLVGTSVRDASFRARYNAAVVAVHRHGERIEQRIGDIVLRPGDTLLLEAAPGFADAFRDSGDFYLVSRREGSAAPRHGRALRAVGILAAVVVAAATGLVPLPLAALLGALAMVLLGCLGIGEARRAVDWSILVVIGAALGMAAALEESGAAALVGEGIAGAAAVLGPWGLLAAVLLGTMLLTEMVTNNAAIALVFPVVIAAAGARGLDPRPFLVAATVAASLSFSTPVGYQTNLMVYGPGKYRFTDFTRVGLPLQLLLAAVTAVSVATVWGLGG